MAVSPAVFEHGPEQVAPLAAVPDYYPSTDHRVPDVIALGGLGTSSRELWLYEPLLNDGTSQLPAEDRFFPPLGRGLVDVKRMIGQMEVDIEAAVEQSGGPVSVLAHSLGVHLGMAVAVKRPELFTSFTGAGGVGFGIDSLLPVARGVKTVLRKAKGVKDIMRDSPYMQEHIARVTNEWSPELPVTLLATPLDELAKFCDTLGIELPPGQTAEKRVIVPPIPGIGWALRKKMGLPPDAELIRSNIPALHAFLPLHPEVIKYERRLRYADVTHPAQFMIAAAASPRPKLQLATA